MKHNKPETRRGRRRWQSIALVMTFPAIMIVFGLWLSISGAMTSESAAFSIASPTAGATVTNPVKLRVIVQGAELGRPIMGRDHLHVSVDGGPAQALYDNRVLRLRLAPGQHTIGVELAGPTHRALLKPQFVSFVVNG